MRGVNVSGGALGFTPGYYYATAAASTAAEAGAQPSGAEQPATVGFGTQVLNFLNPFAMAYLQGEQAKAAAKAASKAPAPITIVQQGPGLLTLGLVGGGALLGAWLIFGKRGRRR